MRGTAAADSGNNNGVKDREEEELEESVSLCDLPIDEDKDSLISVSKPAIESEEEFNFFDHHVISKVSEMCVADEVFFQGQILPLRHSVSCDGSGIFTKIQSDQRNGVFSRSDSMDHSNYSGGLTSASSRSSSINSHHSLSSGSSSSITTTAAATNNSKLKPPPRVRNHFQYSHPSPKPQIRSSSFNSGNSNRNTNSGMWSLFRVGLMTPPEIAIQDLKNRSNSNKNNTPTAQSFGSRNSNSSNTSSTISGAKRKQSSSIFFNKNGMLFGGCKCTANSVGPNPNPNPSRISEKQHAMKMTKHQRERKKALSSHRTFEWLKQLSLEPAMDEQL